MNFPAASPSLDRGGLFLLQFFPIDDFLDVSANTGAPYEKAQGRVDLWVPIGDITRLGTKMD